MTDAKQIKDLVALYEKYGWTLRRVLLSAELRAALGTETAAIFGIAAIETSDINAAWFERRSQPGMAAWELRLISNDPFAVVEVRHDGEDDEDWEIRVAEAEDRVRQRSVIRHSGH